ncbi:hypothetical protein KDA00_06025 [Candidatus Saccharibacteria bacterium]|nr:hypothetical protein [Candidatus Saccharibacteria bacterium]
MAGDLVTPATLITVAHNLDQIEPQTPELRATASTFRRAANVMIFFGTDGSDGDQEAPDEATVSRLTRQAELSARLKAVRARHGYFITNPDNLPS